MAISKTQPMRPALIDVVDSYSNLEEGLEDTNTVVGQLNRELGAEIERATAEDRRIIGLVEAEEERAMEAEQDNATAISNESGRAQEAERANATAIQEENSRALLAEQALTNAIAAIPAIEYGAQNNVEVLAGDNASVSVTFTDEKLSTPYVLVSVQTAETEGVSIADCYAIITSVSTTGFTARVQNKDSANTIDVTLYWIAIGE